MKIKSIIKHSMEKRKGFTLLFAVLVSTLVVSIGATVVSIAVRQTILSGTSRESQYAFYAANTVLECVFYWDVAGTASLTEKVFPGQGDTLLADMSNVTCSGGNVVTRTGFVGAGTFGADGGWTDNSGYSYTVKMEIRDVTGTYDHTYCAEATISKVTGGDGVVTTTIEAKGYNTCDLNNPRAVERGLRQTYES